jgi:alanyl-tRNA synthetase
VSAEVDQAKRGRTIRNHSATHLMHKALREVLGGHVAQKGSLVDPDKTRFDFSHNAPMTAEQIAEVEAIVNKKSWKTTPPSAAYVVRRRRQAWRDGAVRRKIRR